MPIAILWIIVILGAVLLVSGFPHSRFSNFCWRWSLIVDAKYVSGVKVALPPDSIAKVWRYDKWKCGLNWMNDGIIHCEIITPSDSEYKNVKDKAIRKTLKES